MDTSTLISSVMTNYDNISSADADNADRRVRYLQMAQEVFDTAYYFREWPFRYKTGTVTLAAAGTSVKLPATFHQFGVQGGVYNASSGMRLEEVSALDVLAAQQAGQSNPGIFTVLTQDSTDGLPYLQFGGTVAANTDFDIVYLQTSPTLVDTTGNASKLQFIPVAYHNTVLLPGVVARTKQTEGDMRNWEDRFQRGLSKMVQDERPFKTAVRRMPFAVNMW